MSPYLILFLSGTCSAVASLLLRLAGQLGPLVFTGTTSPLMSAGVLYRGFALVSYGLGFVLYALALRNIKLNIAYPFMVGITLLEIFLFSSLTGDTLSTRAMLGAGFLIAGVYLLYS